MYFRTVIHPDSWEIKFLARCVQKSQAKRQRKAQDAHWGLAGRGLGGGGGLQTY